MKDRKILALVLVIVLVMSSFTFAFGVSPGLKTTDLNGNETQKNHFDTKQDVYIYGSNIPDGNYYVRVTNPGGSDNLGTSATASLVVSGGIINPNPARIWDHVQFADTTNNGGQYKAWISKDFDDSSAVKISTKTFSVADATLGSITFNKDVRNVTNDATSFQVMIAGPDNYSNTINIVEGTPVVVPGLFFGDYHFYEVVPQGYTGITTQGSITISINNLNPTFQFVNDQITTTPTGILTIEKEVWIDDVEDIDNNSVFTFMVDGKTVTASALHSGTIELEVGTYVVTETGYGNFTPDATTLQAIVTTEGETVRFVNRYTTTVTPTGILTIAKDVYIDNQKIVESNVVFTFSVDGKTVTASAIQSGTIELEVGTYVVTETGYGMYTPDATTQQAIVTTEGGLVTFVNRYTTPSVTAGSIRIDKSVNGNQSNQNDVFTFVITQAQSEGQWSRTVTASAIQDGIALDLEPGTYIVTEQNPSPYTLQTANNVPVTVAAGNESLVQFTNRYNVSIQTTTYEMSITKTANAAEVNVGDLITYTITVTNTGNGTLTNVSVKDEMVDLDEVIATLAPGASQTFTANYLATEVGLLENTAIATDNQAPTVQDEALVFVVQGPPLGVPGMTISKTVVETPGQVFKPGDTVQFKILVTNIGTEKLENILVEDALAGFLQSIPSLDPGQSHEFTVSVTIAKDYKGTLLENIATATNTKIGTLEAIEIIEIVEEIPLAIPDTGTDASVFAYGAGAMLSLLGLLKKKRR